MIKRLLNRFLYLTMQTGKVKRKIAFSLSRKNIFLFFILPYYVPYKISLCYEKSFADARTKRNFLLYYTRIPRGGIAADTRRSME
jgi:hypothetical protein